MKTLKFLFATVLLLTQVACLEISEVLQVEGDKTTMNLSIFVPDLPDQDGKKTGEVKTSKKPEELIKLLAGSQVQGVKFLGEKDQSLNGLNQVSLSFEISSLADLAKIYKILDENERKSSDKPPSDAQAQEDAFGKIFSSGSLSVKKAGNGDILITRSFKPDPSLAKAKPKKKSKEGGPDFSEEMGEIFLNMIYINFEFFSPSDIVSSNAQQQFGRNLRWRTSLGYLMKNPLKLEMRLKASPELDKMAK